MVAVRTGLQIMNTNVQGVGDGYSLHPTASATLSTGGALSMSVTSKDIEMSLQVRLLG